MSTIRTLQCLLAFAGTASLSACDAETPYPQEPARVAPAGPVVRAAQIRRPVEEHYAAISQTVPGFAGEYFEGDVRVALVTDLAHAAKVRMAVASRSAEQPGLRTPSDEVKVRRVMYSFVQLREWRDLVFDHVLGTAGVFSLDLDEVRNRVAIGIGKSANRESIEARLRAIGVPLEAVVFTESGPGVEDVATLQDPERLDEARKPLRGGKEIVNLSVGGLCTLGFNAIWDGKRVFITNSHCTTQKWGPDQTQFGMDGVSIGIAVYDPPPWPCGPLGIYDCRNSDAAVIAHPWLPTSDILYKIARPLPGSLVIDAANPTIEVWGKHSHTSVGMAVHKIGRTTGWTSGYIVAVCEDEWVEGPDTDAAINVCVDKANYASDGGDSGSPVFTLSPGGGYAIIAGIHFGRDSEGPSLSRFSSIGAIELDLGAVDPTGTAPLDPPPPTVSIYGPSEVQTVGTYQWQAVINAPAPYTYEWYFDGDLVGTDESVSLWIDASVYPYSLELVTNYGSASQTVTYTGGQLRATPEAPGSKGGVNKRR